MLYTLDDLNSVFGSALLTAGHGIAQQHSFTSIRTQPGGEVITATLPSAGAQPLRIYVRLARRFGKLLIQGECSCAVRINCQHVAALLIHLLQSDTQPSPAIDIARHSTDASVNLPTKRPNRFLVYILHPQGYQLAVDIRAATVLEDGRFSVQNRYDPRLNRPAFSANAASKIVAKIVQDNDIPLLDALNHAPRIPLSTMAGSNIAILDDTSSIATLNQLIATGRSFLREVNNASKLTAGPERKLEFCWIVDKFGTQRLTPRIEPPTDLICLLSSPFYIGSYIESDIESYKESHIDRYKDQNSKQIGRLQSPLPVSLIRELLALPAVTALEIGTANTKLQLQYAEHLLPALQVLEIVPATVSEPLPCLTLTSTFSTQESGQTDHYDYATLSFFYGVRQLGRDAPSTYMEAGRVIQITRNLSAEMNVMPLLQHMGLDFDAARPGILATDCLVPNGNSALTQASDWYDFQLKHIPTLKAKGWRIEYLAFRHELVEASAWSCDVRKLDQQDWFSLRLDVEIQGERVNLLPILLSFLQQHPQGLAHAADISHDFFFVTLDAQRQLPVPVKWILPILHSLLEILRRSPRVDDQRIPIDNTQLARLISVQAPTHATPVNWLGDHEAMVLIKTLRDISTIPEVALPTGLMTTLRPYQQAGLNWLQFLRQNHLAGILADDMGLGKTVQTLAHLLLEKQLGHVRYPSLIIAPTSLLFNWRREVERFCPDLTLLTLHGPQRAAQFQRINDYDMVISTYSLLIRDADKFLAGRYHLLILDEAQMIKNPKSQASQIVRKVKSLHRLCLTGTPMENHLGELWSLFDFLMPGLLGDNHQFVRLFRRPIEQTADMDTAALLNRRIRPFLLRRTKQQVATELPPKIEIVRSVALEGKQRELYETVRLSMHRRVREEIETQGLARSHLIVLDALLKLRQVCCDPRLLKFDGSQTITESAKLEFLLSLLPQMLEQGRRILLFSQFTTMLGIIESELNKAGIAYVKLTGKTIDRETPIRQFQDGNTPLFLISLKAGGVGLNLTAADTVIHYDPWWNPAVERQASDRAHRIGQQRSVFVYKLLTEGTLEEKIMALQQRKQALADNLFDANGGSVPQWDEHDLEQLFAPLE